uniref:Uncharacterized protein n=1 Tax=Nelumbo nucifera TaxID=4432 RepID=A0A822Z1U8_NELNU|nr:TPA_asm: hypothetical protein HUJ06_014717 [Nelumbo nucifera]
MCIYGQSKRNGSNLFSILFYLSLVLISNNLNKAHQKAYNRKQMLITPHTNSVKLKYTEEQEFPVAR